MHGRTIAIGLAVLTSIVLVSGTYARKPLFTGTVVVDHVQLRAGAGDYYVVGELARGQSVQVLDVLYGWYKITPPAGVHSYVNRADVVLASDGKMARVKRDRVSVKTANMAGPGDSWRVQMVLVKDDIVRIVAREGSFFKIVSPTGAAVFAPPDSIARAKAPRGDGTDVTEQVTSDAQPKNADASKNTQKPVKNEASTQAVPIVVDDASAAQDDSQSAMLTGESATDSNDKTQPVDETPDVMTTPAPPVNDEAAPALIAQAEPPAPDIESADAIVLVKQPTAIATMQSDEAPDDPAAALVEAPTPQGADAAFRAAMNRPLRQRPVDQLLSDYQTLAADNALSYHDRLTASTHVAHLQYMARATRVLADIDGLQDELAAAQQARASAVPVQRPVRYDATGRLVVSTVFDGRRLPRLYRLVNPQGGGTVGYVRPSATFDPTESLGRVVQIVGKPRFDPNLKLHVIDPVQVHVASAGGFEPSAGPAVDNGAQQRADSSPF